MACNSIPKVGACYTASLQASSRQTLARCTAGVAEYCVKAWPADPMSHIAVSKTARLQGDIVGMMAAQRRGIEAAVASGQHLFVAKLSLQLADMVAAHTYRLVKTSDSKTASLLKEKAAAKVASLHSQAAEALAAVAPWLLQGTVRSLRMQLRNVHHTCQVLMGSPQAAARCEARRAAARLAPAPDQLICAGCGKESFEVKRCGRCRALVASYCR